MKKVIFFACSIFIAGGFMFLGMPGGAKKNSHSGNEYFPGNPQETAEVKTADETDDETWTDPDSVLTEEITAIH